MSKKVAIYLNHPSHYYIYRQIIFILINNGTSVKVYIKDKDILKELLNKGEQEYLVIGEIRKKNTIILTMVNLLKKYRLLYMYLSSFKPDLLISCGSDVAFVAKLRGIPSLVLNDDDAKVVPISALIGWPFVKCLFVPSACDMGYWERKTIHYNGYQKLFYLHPKYFIPNHDVVKKYIDVDEPYILIRSVSLTAHHDKGIRGLNNEIVEMLIKKLSNYAKVFISSERELSASLENYRLKINPLDMHHLIYYANLLISDGQSMVQEAAIMGTPSLRYNDFIGRIGVMEELEHKYGLTYGISPDNPDYLIEKAEELIKLNDIESYKRRAKEMIDTMIDPVAMIVWFVENYPKSEKEMRGEGFSFERFK